MKKRSIKAGGKKLKPGQPIQCKVCSHDHLLEIETALLVHKMPSREVEKMILTNGWEPVSYVTLLNHMNKHIDQKRELIIRYLEEKRQLIDNVMSVEDDPELDEMMVRLNELKKLDMSIGEATMLVKQSSKALQEQLALRVEHPDAGSKTKTGNNVTDTDRKPASKKRAYVPIQRDLIALYKGASEELRMTIKTKLDTLGVDAASKQASSMETLVDLIMDVENKNEENAK